MGGKQVFLVVYSLRKIHADYPVALSQVEPKKN